ncbi:MAG: class II aldolase/adducin family protein [Clostridia bacterium]|nr:class II aldolase/adducin family protein [Clostridia bacterium]
MKDSEELRQKVIETCLTLREQGYMFGTWGNISVRLDDGNILITPSKLDYAEMKPEDLPVISPDGSIISGTRLPTSEREIHRGMMNRRPDMNAVIHTHSPYAMACSAIEGGIPAFSEEIAQLFGGPIRLSEKFAPSDAHVELGKVVCDSFGNDNALLIRNHGPIVLGRTLDEAFVSCQVLEKSAKIYINLLQTGAKINVLSDEAVARGRDYFLNGYGRT